VTRYPNDLEEFDAANIATSHMWLRVRPVLGSIALSYRRRTSLPTCWNEPTGSVNLETTSSLQMEFSSAAIKQRKRTHPSKLLCIHTKSYAYTTSYRSRTSPPASPPDPPGTHFYITCLLARQVSVAYINRTPLLVETAYLPSCDHPAQRLGRSFRICCIAQRGQVLD
jgi:hypothetical protein